MAQFPKMCLSELTRTTLPCLSEQSLPEFDALELETDEDAETEEEHMLEQDILHDCLHGDEEDGERAAHSCPANLNSFDLGHDSVSHLPVVPEVSSREVSDSDMYDLESGGDAEIGQGQGEGHSMQPEPEPDLESDSDAGERQTLEQIHAVHGTTKDDFLHGCFGDDDEYCERTAYQCPSDLDSFDIDELLGPPRPVALGDFDDFLTEMGVNLDAPVMMVKTRFVIDPAAIRGVQAVHKLLAVGTFTEVYHCSFENRDGVISEVALKLFDEYVRPEETELVLMSELNHPNLVSLHDVIEGLPCGLVLELCAGGNLHEFLHGKGHREIAQSCSLQTRLRAVHGIACALQYLHSYNIIHRDVKSGHCFLAGEADKDVLPAMKLGDLKVACEVNQNCMAGWQGTVRYMAPEMMESNTYDVAAGIFSCGTLLHEVLSNQIPHSDMTGVNEAQLAMHICAGRRPSLEIFSNFEGSAAICDVIRQTWALPASRPPAGKLIMQIEELIRSV